MLGGHFVGTNYNGNTLAQKIKILANSGKFPSKVTCF